MFAMPAVAASATAANIFPMLRKIPTGCRMRTSVAFSYSVLIAIELI
jgi:hypothetical protein